METKRVFNKRSTLVFGLMPNGFLYIISMWLKCTTKYYVYSITIKVTKIIYYWFWKLINKIQEKLQ